MKKISKFLPVIVALSVYGLTSCSDDERQLPKGPVVHARTVGSVSFGSIDNGDNTFQLVIKNSNNSRKIEVRVTMEGYYTQTVSLQPGEYETFHTFRANWGRSCRVDGASTFSVHVITYEGIESYTVGFRGLNRVLVN